MASFCARLVSRLGSVGGHDGAAAALCYKQAFGLEKSDRPMRRADGYPFAAVSSSTVAMCPGWCLPSSISARSSAVPRTACAKGTWDLLDQGTAQQFLHFPCGADLGGGVVVLQDLARPLQPLQPVGAWLVAGAQHQPAVRLRRPLATATI